MSPKNRCRSGWTAPRRRPRGSGGLVEGGGVLADGAGGRRAALDLGDDGSRLSPGAGRPGKGGAAAGGSRSRARRNRPHQRRDLRLWAMISVSFHRPISRKDAPGRKVLSFAIYAFLRHTSFMTAIRTPPDHGPPAPRTAACKPQQTHQTLAAARGRVQRCSTRSTERHPHLREELGDVLIQVVFHAQLAAGDFTFDDVAREIIAKWSGGTRMLAARADTSAQVIEVWEQVKAREKAAAGRTESAGSTAAAAAAGADVRGGGGAAHRRDRLPIDGLLIARRRRPGRRAGRRRAEAGTPGRGRQERGIDPESALRRNDRIKRRWRPRRRACPGRSVTPSPAHHPPCSHEQDLRPDRWPPWPASGSTFLDFWPGAALFAVHGAELPPGGRRFSPLAARPGGTGLRPPALGRRATTSSRCSAGAVGVPCTRRCRVCGPSTASGSAAAGCRAARSPAWRCRSCRGASRSS